MKKQIKARLIVVWMSAFLLVYGFYSNVIAGTDQPPQANKMKPDHAPTPYTAMEIREGCPEGRKIVFQVEMFGKPFFYQTIEFITAKEDEVIFETVSKGPDGKPVGKRQMTVGKWKDLQSHASFPDANTTISSVSFTAPVGTFDCWRYDVRSSKDGKTTEQYYWFAKKIPGPPVCVEEKVDGKLSYKMVMLKTGIK